MLSQSFHQMLADLAFPGWLRLAHFINLLFIGLLIRSGIQILGAHPRLYWKDDCRPGNSWIKFTRKKFQSISSIPRWMTILAYEMNGQPLPLEHGAPLRLRVETQLGYKMVKYLRSLELVADYSKVGDGQGGWREDIQFYGRGAEI